ncbi:MAG: hypothetical protein WED11_05905, partial [Natronospirillum sp.]
MTSHFDAVPTKRRHPPDPVVPMFNGKQAKCRSFRVLLVTSSLGSGHTRAAQALAQGIRSHHPYADVHTLDYWSLIDRKVAHAVRTAYLRLVQEHPELYDRVYHLNQGTWRTLLESKDPLPPEITAMTKLLPTPFVS